MREKFDPAARRRHEGEKARDICLRPWKTAVPPIQVSPHTWFVGNEWVGVFWIDTGEGLILLDAGMPPQTYLIFEGMRSCGFDPHDIKLALLSHAHFDHCGGMRAVIEYTGAKLYAAAEDTEELLHPTELLKNDYQIVIPDAAYEPEGAIRLGSISVEPVVVGGHTPGTTCFFYTDTDETGTEYKVGIHGGLGLSKLADDYFKRPEDAFAARDAYRRAQEMVIDRPVDIALSFHPYNVSIVERAAASGGDWRAQIDANAWKSMELVRLQNLADLEEASAFQKR